MKPKIGITMGDPAGVGPELIIKLLKNKNFDLTDFIIFGSYTILKNELNKYKINVENWLMILF